MVPSPTPLGASQRHHPRRFEDFTYAYAVISRRSGGVSVGVNLNLDKICNFACPYCQVDRKIPGLPQKIDSATLLAEVTALLDACDEKGICRLPRFDGIPDAQKTLRDVALSGDGEPTMVPEFAAICRQLADMQAQRPSPPFKLVLITNATLLDREGVQKGVASLLENNGEVWAKLDAGTEAYFQRINHSRFTLAGIEANLRKFGERHPYTLQSFFCRLDGQAPDEVEIQAYLDRIRRLQSAGSRISEVQIYSLARPPAESSCSPLETVHLESIASRIRDMNLTARVFATAD